MCACFKLLELEMELDLLAESIRVLGTIEREISTRAKVLTEFLMI